MALAVELTSNSGALTNVTGATFSHTVTSGTKQVCTVAMGNSPVANCSLSGITWNTTENFNFVGRKNDTNFESVEEWELPNVATGTHNIVMTVTSLNSIAQFEGGCSSVTGGPQSAVGAASSATATTDNPSVTVADTAANDLVFSVVASDAGSGTSTTPGGSQLWEAEDIGGGDSDFNAQSQIASGANTVCSWTATQSGNRWAAIGFAVKAAAAAASNPIAWVKG